MNRLVLVADVPHRTGGHMLLVSSLNHGFAEFYLAPRIQAGRQTARWYCSDAISVSRATFQSADGIESHRTVSEVLLLLGVNLKDLTEEQLDRLFQKLEQRLADVSTLSIAEITDRLGSLHLCPQLANWLDADGFGALIMKQPTIQPVEPRRKPWTQNAVWPQTRLRSSLAVLLVFAAVLLVHNICDDSVWKKHELNFERPAADDSPTISAESSNRAAPIATYNIGDIRRSRKNEAQQAGAAALLVAQTSQDELEKRTQPWSEAQKRYADQADAIAYDLRDSPSSAVDDLRKRFVEGLFDALRDEISVIEQDGSRSLKELEGKSESLNADAVHELVVSQGQRIASLLTFVKDNRSVLLKCLPDDDSNTWHENLRRLARQSLRAHYGLIKVLLMKSLLGADREPSISIGSLSGVARWPLASLSDNGLLPEIKTEEDEFRSRAKFNESKMLDSLTAVKGLTFVVKSKVNHVEIQSASLSAGSFCEPDKIYIPISTLEDLTRKQPTTLIVVAKDNQHR